MNIRLSREWTTTHRERASLKCWRKQESRVLEQDRQRACRRKWRTEVEEWAMANADDIVGLQKLL